MQYTIYQLNTRTPRDERPYDYEFMRWDYAEKNGFNFKEHYEKVYNGTINKSGSDHVILDGYLWEKFNINHPSDFKGHSLSVSDIVQLNDKYYYCDSFGWKDITSVIKQS